VNNQRGRPRVDPTIRYRDVLPYWTAAEMRMFEIPTGLLITIPCTTAGKAVALMHRLNLARRHMVNDNPQLEVWDVMSVAAEGTNVVIRNKPKADLSIVLDHNGVPLTAGHIAEVMDRNMTRGLTSSTPQTEENKRRAAVDFEQWERNQRASYDPNAKGPGASATIGLETDTDDC